MCIAPVGAPPKLKNRNTFLFFALAMIACVAAMAVIIVAAVLWMTGGSPLSGNVAYLSSMGNNAVYTLNVDTGKISPAFNTSLVPDRCLLSKDGQKAYVASGKVLSITDPMTGNILKTLSFDKDIWYMAVTADGSRLCLYCGTEHDNPGDVAIIDTARDQVAGIIRDVPFSWGMDVSPDGRYLYVGDYFDCRLVVIDLDSIAIVNSIPCASPQSYYGLSYWKDHQYWSGAGCAGDVAASPDGRRVYVSRWSDNRLSIIDVGRMELEKEVPMYGRSSDGVAVSPDSSRVYVTNHDTGYILVYDSTSDTLIEKIMMRPELMRVDVSGDGRHLLVSYEDGGMDLVNLASGVISSYRSISPSFWFPSYS